MRIISRMFLALGMAGLAVITLTHPGATRMYAWPWSMAYACVLLTPVLLLLVRTLNVRQPFMLPAGGWALALGLSSAVILGSAVASPYSGSSLQWSAVLLSAIAVHLLVFDWLNANPTEGALRQHRFHTALLIGTAVITCVSVALWLATLPRAGIAGLLGSRNPFPLGHSNYTAGVAVLLLPFALRASVRGRGLSRALAAAMLVVAFIVLFSSGSRGGLIGAAAIGFLLVLLAPVPRRRKWQLGAIAGIAALAFALAHPRTRASLVGGGEPGLIAASGVQRRAMLEAGLQMGRDRPLLGWGPGTTPLVYPKYRRTLDGGAENVLQLHSTPIQVWAELGLAGLACLIALGVIGGLNWRRDLLTTVALAGYGALSLSDWQLDVPVFAFATAGLAATLAPPRRERVQETSGSKIPRLSFAGFTLVALLAIIGLGERDPTPAMNARALALAASPDGTDESIALLRASLALNPDQEIAHFNLGWLLVVRAPLDAEKHFIAAAGLVPDKGGVYFGIALARLNQDRRDEAALAMALECLNDPQFLHSPWWQEPAIAALRDSTEAALLRHINRARSLTPPTIVRQLDQLSARVSQLGRVSAGAQKTYRRERTGYPVLMRNLDLPTPVDLFDVRESAAPDPSLPLKGWLPSPVLLTLLSTTASPPLPASRSSP